MSAVLAPLGALPAAEPAPVAGSRHPHLLCITLFNEPLAELRRSLASVAANLREAPLVPPLSLALVLDGVRHAAADVLQWLQQVGFAVGPAHTDQWQQQTVSLASLSGLGGKGGKGGKGGPSVEVWLHLKASNRGKLDSHAVFFQTLCAPLQPDIVFQLDVGTTVGEQAFVRTLAHFERAPTVAALSSRCAAQAPADDDGFVQGWQFFDTAAQLATVWPTEQLCGQLSVIPGQFCALRWRALTQLGADGVTPLHRYLRGLSTASRFERTMFLAEDRVIGQALTLAPGARWQLIYGSDVHATNDACTTLGELMRQRRRWNNGANACRLALLRHGPAHLCRSDRGLTQRAHFGGGLLWQAVQLLQQLFDPATWLCSVWLLALAMRAVWERGHPGVVMVAVASLAWGMYATARSHRRRAELAWWCAAMGGVAVLYQGGLAFSAILLLFGPPMVTLALVAWMYPAHAGLVLRRGPEHLWCDVPLRLLLWGYSLLRLGDVSWGTKGLHQATAAPRWWRNPACWALPAWGALNLIAVWHGSATLQVDGGALTLPPVLMAARGITLFCVLGGCLFLLQQRWRRPARRRVAVSAPRPALREELQ